MTKRCAGVYEPLACCKLTRASQKLGFLSSIFECYTLQTPPGSGCNSMQQSQCILLHAFVWAGVQDWSQVTALLNCGVGPNAGKKETIQVSSWTVQFSARLITTAN